MGLDATAMIADVIMIRSLTRDALSYFRTYRDYFVAIFAVFLAFPGSNLALILVPEDLWMRIATQCFLVAGVAIATIWGYVATRLYLYPEPFSVKRVLSKPFRPIFLVYAIYLVPMLLGILIGLGDPAEILTDSSVKVLYLLEGVTLPTATLGRTLLLVGASVVIAFIIYPSIVLIRLRSKFKDKDVRESFIVFTSSFGAIALILLLAVALSSLGYSIQALANLSSVILIVAAVRAFRKPTFLKSFLGVLPSLVSTPTISHVDQTVLIYVQDNERSGPISRYILDGVNRQYRVIYFYRGDESIVRDELTQNGIDVRRYILTGSLRLLPFGTLYQTRGTIDETPLELIEQLASEAHALHRDGLTIVVDYEDFTAHPIRNFVEHLSNARWTTPDHYVHVLMVFSSAAFQGEEASLALLERRIRTLDLSESADTLSSSVGLSHEEIKGRKLLMEFDPQSDYDRIFKSLFSDSALNFERTVIFTRKDSNIYPLAQRQPGARVFVLTSRVSYPRVESENRVLLPAYDPSILLDSLSKTVETYAGSSFTIIFDNISHYIFTLGPERTHSLVRQALELMVSDKITAVFSVNSKAHDQKTLSKFEDMFDIQIGYELGGRLPEVRRRETVIV